MASDSRALQFIMTAAEWVDFLEQYQKQPEKATAIGLVSPFCAQHRLEDISAVVGKDKDGKVVDVVLVNRTPGYQVGEPYIVMDDADKTPTFIMFGTYSDIYSHVCRLMQVSGPDAVFELTLRPRPDLIEAMRRHKLAANTHIAQVPAAAERFVAGGLEALTDDDVREIRAVLHQRRAGVARGRGNGRGGAARFGRP